MAAFLRQIGGREIDRDAPRRQREAGGHEGRAHALLGLGNGFVGQANDVEGGKAGRDLYLDIDGSRLDALERHRADPLNHCPAPALLVKVVAQVVDGDKNICRTKFVRYDHRQDLSDDPGDTMIDREAMAKDLQLARQARLEAEAANADVEELIWEIQHIQLGRQRMVFSIAGFEQELAA